MARAVKLTVLVLLLFCMGKGETQNVSQVLALTPPRGWNSYNSFSWIVSEEEFLDNARFVSQHLLKFGYEYVVVDFLWYRKLEPGASVWSAGHEMIDQWGRPAPDPGRWPSSRDGSGFTQVAQQVHALGLKFGVHVMRGISTAAIQANTPILGAKGSPDSSTGRPWLAADIAVEGTECKWMSACFVGVNSSSEGGRAFLRSLYSQYASWGVDFIKHDCVFGVEDLRIDEIELVSQAILETGRPITYSLSPGVRATPDMAIKVANISNMYRVTADDWDTWSDLLTHFDVARDFAAAGLTGASNPQGRSWPDLDMLPLGWLTDPGVVVGPHRSCYLSPAEQRTQVSLWAMAKSPLMYGGDLRAIDNATLSLITNSLILDINAHSIDNHELLRTSNEISGTDFRLINCKDGNSTDWFTKLASSPYQADKVCWTGAASRAKRWRKGGELPLGCLDWTLTAGLMSISLKSELQQTDKASTMGFVSSSSQNKCLVADSLLVSNATMRLSTRRTRFAQCSGESDQAWRLTSEGRLMNENTGLCATPIAAEGTRVWVARGSSGFTYYVAFFNLASNATQISVDINTVLRTFGHTHSMTYFSSWYKVISAVMNNVLVNMSTLIMSNFQSCERNVSHVLVCKCLDMWSSRELGMVDKSLSAVVEGHGATVFSLTCSPNISSLRFSLCLTTVLKVVQIVMIISFLVGLVISWL